MCKVCKRWCVLVVTDNRIVHSWCCVWLDADGGFTVYVFILKV